MTTKEKTNPNKTARIAGVLYLILFPLGLFGVLYISSTLIVPGDVPTTANNIMTSESLFRIGFVSDLISATVWLLLPLALYRLLKSVNKTRLHSW